MTLVKALKRTQQTKQLARVSADVDKVRLEGLLTLESLRKLDQSLLQRQRCGWRGSHCWS